MSEGQNGQNLTYGVREISSKNIIRKSFLGVCIKGVEVLTSRKLQTKQDLKTQKKWTQINLSN